MSGNDLRFSIRKMNSGRLVDHSSRCSSLRDLAVSVTSLDARDMLQKKRKLRELDLNLEELRDHEKLLSWKHRQYLMEREKEELEMAYTRQLHDLRCSVAGNTRGGVGGGLCSDAEHGSEVSAVSPLPWSDRYPPKLASRHDPCREEVLTQYIAPPCRGTIGVSSGAGSLSGSDLAFQSHVQSEADLSCAAGFYETKAKCDFPIDAEDRGLNVIEYVEYKIKADSTNMDYENLLQEFLYRSMEFVFIYDPNFLFPHHTDNLARLVHLLHSRTNVKKVMLETCPRTATKSQVVQDLKNLKVSLEKVGIQFEFFCVKLDLDKKPFIRFGRRWKVSLDRGLDIFHPPMSALDKVNVSMRRTRGFNLFAIKYDAV